ncbi:SDR family NAD(P)-dependent oxidoreductase, partial [Streptomyces sp. NPDC088554]|uniref:SDR family NAD(P)-dependent oxidoreductase n=1 Tax=Streptomyces sp. NPDC088554 TaxID=3365865 RepID=UPI003803DB34
GRWEGRIDLAAVNGPASVVVAGGTGELEELLVWAEGEGVRARRIAVDYASHSSQVEEIREELLDVLGGLTPVAAPVPFYSTVTAGRFDTVGLDAAYWYGNLRSTVRLDETVTGLVEAGHHAFVEISPHPVLMSAVQETAESVGREVVVTGTLRRGEGGSERLLLSLGEAYVHGVGVDWQEWFAGSGARPVELPTYAFQHRHYWTRMPGARLGDTALAGLGRAGHPLLGATVELADGDRTVFTGRLSLKDQPWAADHAVFGTPLLPGTAFVELALWAGERLGIPRVDELVLEAPLLFPDASPVRLQVVVDDADERGYRAVRFFSRTEQSGDEEWTRHGTAVLGGAARAEFDLGAWPPPGAQPVELDGAYERMAEAGFGYGPAFRGLRAAWRRGDEVFAEVETDQGRGAAGDGFVAHPALLDAALHGAGLLPDTPDGGARLPFSWSGVTAYATGATSLRVRLTRAGGDGLSLLAVDALGAPVVAVEELTFRPVSADQLAQAAATGPEALLRVDWPVLPVADPPVGRYVWLGTATEGPEPAFGTAAELDAWLGAGNPAPSAAVALCPVPAADDTPAEAAERAALWGLELLRNRTAAPRLAELPLVVVTRDAAPVPGTPAEATGTAHAALAGLMRSAQAEDPGRLVLVDVTAADGPPSPETLDRALAATEPEVAVRGGTIHGRRLVKAVADPDALAEPAGDIPWRLDVTEPGSFGNLALVPDAEGTGPLPEGRVRIAVRAAGLNFRDTLIALGMYPDRARLGSEGCGVVTEVGPGVEWPAPGDRVMGTLDTPFAPHSVADPRLLAPVPESWTDVQGASATVAFLTAYHGLVDLGGLREGRRILIHAGAGGVGSAAVQLARRLGAEVYATASRPKWEALRAAGLDDAHIADSRTLDFHDAFLDATGGRGMDIVLNCLAGEFTDASLRLLPQGGRFVEMGKTDLRDPQHLAAAHPGVDYLPFDLADPGPERIQEILGELGTLFAEGALTPPPATTWDIHHAPEAFRALARATLVGKAVLTLPPAGFAPGETVLVTGGTGTLGALVARHLVERHGARHLLLLSRSGPNSPEAEALRVALAALGADAEVVAGDIGDPDAPDRLHTAVTALGQRLAGVVHCAGTTDDGAIGSLTPERLAAVLRPKAHGAWNLHRLTELHPQVRQFMLFSSAAATLGSPGQANYAAANAFLDAFAHRRRALGLPAVSVGWGLWEQASALTAGLGAADHRRLRSGGFRALPTDEALSLFDVALLGGVADPAVVAAPLDLAALRARHAREPLPPVLHGFLGTAAGSRARRRAAQETHEPGAVLRRRLAALPGERRRSVLLGLVRGQVAAVLGHTTPGLVDTERSFREMGFDSLTAVELRNRLNTATGLRLPATLVFDHPRLDALADHVGAALLPTVVDGSADDSVKEAEIRGLILSVPLARLRESGLLDPLLALASGTRPPAPAPAPEPVDEAADQSGEIRAMDAAALVEMARAFSAE